MGMSFGSRLKHAWNAFTGTDYTTYQDVGPGYSSRPDRIRLTRGNERSIITSVYNRIALDVAALNVQHIRLDENGRFLSVIQDGLNTCLTVEANIDQTARAFIQDIVVSMLDEGCVAIVPVDTTYDPSVTGSYDIQTMRVGKILDWYPQHVRVRLYNERTGTKENILVPKSTVAIIENPLYAVVNEPNSTMQRLIRKLNLLDVIDEQSGSGKLDLIIQLPYVIKTEARRQQAENRRKDIEAQLSGTKYGIAYVKSQMLIGLAHDRIIFLGMHYIERGWITQDEYENLYEYLYKPYEKLGGNGSAKRIMTEVNKLPIRKSTYQPEEVTDHE